MRPVASVIAALAILGLIASFTVGVAAVFGVILIDPRISVGPFGLVSAVPTLYGLFPMRPNPTPRSFGECFAVLPSAARVLLGGPWLLGGSGAMWAIADLYAHGLSMQAASTVRFISGGCTMFFAGTAIHAMARALPAKSRLPRIVFRGKPGGPQP